MRPLFHPPIEGITVEGILHAMSDPVRAAIYGEIVASDYSRSCSNLLELSGREVAKSTLSHHFKILRDAGLILSERRGVEMHNTSRRTEIDARFPGLMAAIVKAHNLQSEGKKHSTKARKRNQRQSTSDGN